MKIKYCGIVILLMLSLFIIPMSFASSPDVDITLNTTSEPVLDSIDSLSEYSYFVENNKSIEEPLIDDDFADIKISYTDRNTFYVNASYSGSKEIGTIENPFKDLNSAVSSLSVNRSVVNIYVAKGTYQLSKTVEITKNINIVGENPLDTIISGNNLTGIFSINKNNLVINIINLTFTQGNTYYGGAIYNNRSSVRLINDFFKNNYAIGFNSATQNYSAAGGALYSEAGTYKLYNSTFIDNLAKSSLNVYGSAIYNDLGTLSVLNSKFINNTISDANYGSGGAIYNFNGFLTVSNSLFSNNVINSNYSIGGAIYNYEAHNIYVINSTFDANKIHGIYTFGSAIANSASLLDIVNSTFVNNLASGIALENTTIYNLNGFYNFINSTENNNIIRNPKENILMCLEDQFVISRPFDDDLLQDLPSKYDLRTNDDVSYAKNQGSSGACWAFSTLAALESFLHKTENASYDFSENNLKNVMGYKGENGTDWGDGGNYQMALAYLLRWDGPIDESDDYFSAYSVVPNYGLTSLKHVQGAMFLPLRLGYLDNNQIKCAIMKYGAVYTSIYGTSMTKNIYNSFANIPNHAVAIVGWDDNYPASRFLGTKPPANGAWIIKNSWGTSYGDKGFGYISYYDASAVGFSLDSLSAMAFTDVEDTTNYKDIYQYDILGNTYESLGFGTNTAYLANQFTAISDNQLSAFGLYTYGKSAYSVDIYVNNDLKYSQEGNLGYGGYHTVKLNQLVDLTCGDIFRLNVRLTTYDSIFPIAIESARNGYSSKANASLNQSFVSADGIHWIDIAQDLEMLKVSGCFYNKTLERANVCLKAYTANSGNLKLNVSSSQPYFYKGDEITLTFNLENIGDYTTNIDLTFTLDSSIVNVNVSKGIFSNNVWKIDDLKNNERAILSITVKMLENKDLSQGSVLIQSLDKIKNNNEVVNFNLTYQGFTDIIAENVTSLSKSCEIVNISLVDLDLMPVSNADVIVNLNGENVTFTTDNSGILRLNIDLFEGSYLCKVYFFGNEKYRPSNSTFNVNIFKRPSILIDVNKTVFYYLEDISVLLINESGNPLANKLITFKVGNNVYNSTTDNNGFCNFTGLKEGNYIVNALFSGDEFYTKSQNIFNISVIKKDTTLTSSNINTNAIVVKVDKKTGPYLRITLKDENNQSVVNRSISVKLASDTYDVVTNDEGVASLQVNIAKSGTYTAKINFLGDDIFKNSSTTSKIVIKKKKMSLKVPKKTYNVYKKVKTLTATLKDNKGKVISGKKIYFKINGKIYNSKTNKKGVASVKVKITKKKTYTVSVSFKGDSSYNKVTTKSKLTIK
ncbi:lectin like domain-containing protein [Methanobrevibacter sp.]|uniref:lectin like domain-containing protein n=1 Tax=Methanobrevibacter sp. TaxID=66852 RepID=UPI0038683987